MDLGLSGRTAVVTGASRGIGLAITRTLAGEGVRVVAASRTASPELDALGVLHVPVDLTAPGAPEQVVAAALDAYGGLDVLVNNVGGGGTFNGGFLGIGDADWAATFALNFLSAVRVTRAALPSLLERRGSIVTISSVAARVPQTAIDYGAAKAALNNVSKALAGELADRGVRVNTITAGVTRTPAFEEALGGMVADGPDAVQRLLDRVGVSTGRLVEPVEIGALVAFLASDLAVSITGADLVVDGNMIKAV